MDTHTNFLAMHKRVVDFSVNDPAYVGQAASFALFSQAWLAGPHLP